MSESLDGFNVAAIRQNAGRSAKALPPPRPPPPAGANAPATTACAMVIVASVSLRDDRLSHGAAAAGIERRTSNTGTANNKIDFLIWAPQLVCGKLATKRHESQEETTRGTKGTKSRLGFCASCGFFFFILRSPAEAGTAMNEE